MTPPRPRRQRSLAADVLSNGGPASRTAVLLVALGLATATIIAISSGPASVSTATRSSDEAATYSFVPGSMMHGGEESPGHDGGRRLMIGMSSRNEDERTVPVYGFLDGTPMSRKQHRDVQLQPSHPWEEEDGDKAKDPASGGIRLDPVFLTLQEQREYVATRCPPGLNKFDELLNRQQDHLAVELWKYCALSQSGGGVYLDSASPLLAPSLASLLRRAKNMAVLGSSYLPSTVHGSFLALSGKNTALAHNMMTLIVQTDSRVLETTPLLLPRALYAYIASQLKEKLPLIPGNTGDWFFLEQSCHLNPLQRRPSSSESSSPSAAFSTSWLDPQSYRLTHNCPDASGFCCSVLDITQEPRLVMLTRHPILPYQTLPTESQLARPYNAETGHVDEDDLPFVATIRERVHKRPPDSPATPNFFETLLSNECLPDDEPCSKCLRNKNGANCKTCAGVCGCYCKMLCRDPVAPKFVSKELIVTPPAYHRDPSRLIPRIVHQTWFETLTVDKYPNLSRLVESFRRSGWEYKFYSDEDAQNFLSTHFPAEVREAYDALRPGAFKADLFRYCVLLIYGGVYADVDILLESTLDFSVADDVGFMVPVDEPGIPVDKRMCLWNGLIAAAPAHPFLLQVIETVVNQVRNRFTAVDTDATFCPNPELSVLHAFDTLFTAGPCQLGASLNRVLGRNAQTGFKPGEIKGAKGGRGDIPGRTIILAQNKWDMGAHRFTWLERNLVVAATDLPDSNDRENLKDKQGGGGGGEHYSKTHAKIGIYGLQGLYVDKTRADEEIRLVRDDPSTKRVAPVTKES
jgi:Glycosyltransferase sugar-binding region containing DXD motif